MGTNKVGKAYITERYILHPLTPRNQEELEIAAKVPSILEQSTKELTEKGQWIAPTGFSLNEVRYGDFPQDEESAHQRGWLSYMNVGVPRIEERSDIEQPAPDLISLQTYVNATDPEPTEWEHSVEFTISNTISWSLQGQVQLTFGAKTIAELQSQLQKSVQSKQALKKTVLNSKDRQGADIEDLAESTSTATATGTATGTGELWAQLMLGITAEVSGSLTTSWTSRSTLRGRVGSRVDVRSTQRRQVKQFDYEFPIDFGGYVALYYPEPVYVRESPPQDRPPNYSHVVAKKMSDLGISDEGKPFTQYGEAEIVSTLAGEHTVFDYESLHYEDQPLYKG
ncbi:hypothetical protein F4561_006377 [Lipingzhangella halophila]|uniref:Toxin ETX/toxin MTX2 n=1 Tax=Lipingzhangella halophila TaxID=1783352 RepID=A0A7W7RPY0_9ACTN|nr:gluconolaconase [Lipingzhangella halophila]MBB4935483.1 hypothetical protein [Lipingzhangella halophila]